MNKFSISTDKQKLDLELIFKFLSERSYWAKGRSKEVVSLSIENSLCFGVYNQANEQIGFARVLTDYAVFAYIMDVFVLENYRGHGIGKQLMETIMGHPEIQHLQRIMLATADAHGLYSQFGFKITAIPDKLMEIVNHPC